MSYLGKVFGASFLSLLVATFPVYTCSYAESDAAAPAPDSESLTQYLHSQRLPLVSAQVSASEGGGRDVVLYGFVATELGSQHAEEHVRTFMHDSSIKIENRIKIRPEIASLKDPSKKRTTKKSPQKQPVYASAPPPSRKIHSYMSSSGPANETSEPYQAPASTFTSYTASPPPDIADANAYQQQDEAYFGPNNPRGVPLSGSTFGPDMLQLFVMAAAIAGMSSGGGVGIRMGPSFGPTYTPYMGNYSGGPYSRHPGLDPFMTNPDPAYSGSSQTYSGTSGTGYDPNAQP